MSILTQLFDVGRFFLFSRKWKKMKRKWKRVPQMIIKPTSKTLCFFITLGYKLYLYALFGPSLVVTTWTNLKTLQDSFQISHLMLSEFNPLTPGFH